MKQHILNIEGIPGSGKSTASAQLNRLFRAANIDSYWVCEEAENHPVGTATLPRTDGVEKLANSYLQAWEVFVSKNTRVAVLDGYALQSSIRFLFAMNASQSVMYRYFQSWQRIGEFSSSIVFMKVENPEQHFREFVFPLRGEEWCRKVSSYVSSTPFSRERGLIGNEGMIEFWSKYQRVCLDLLRDPVIATRIQNHADRSWIESQLNFIQRTIDE